MKKRKMKVKSRVDYVGTKVGDLQPIVFDQSVIGFALIA